MKCSGECMNNNAAMMTIGGSYYGFGVIDWIRCGWGGGPAFEVAGVSLPLLLDPEAEVISGHRMVDDPC